MRDVLEVFNETELAEARTAAGISTRSSPKRGENEDGPAAAKPNTTAATGLPRIECGPDLHESTHAAECALAALDEPKVYTSARALVIVAWEGAARHRGIRRDPDSPFIHQLALPGLREHLARGAEWYFWDRRHSDWARGLPPSSVVAALAARGNWPLLPRLAGIVEVPSMRFDGTILDVPGFDASSGILFDPRGTTFPVVPREPTAEDVRRAVEDLREPFIDFEWQNQEEDLAVVVALALTHHARPMFDGASPCFGFDSSTRGSGKGLASDVAVMIGSGRRPAVSILSGDSDEQRKSLFVLTLEGHRSILFDNITQPFGGAVLSAVLTSGEIRDRVLGESRSRVAPFSAVMVLTGNGLRFVGDFDRRVLVARQAPTVENPEDREPKGGFRHPNLREWVAAEYPRLVVAGLTILRAFHVAGRPAHGLKAMGSFESWDAVVRGACIWAGIGDPLASRERIRVEADDDRERIQGLLTAWRDVIGSSPATLAQAVERSNAHSALRQALAEFDSKGDLENPNLTSIGRRIRAVVGRIVSGLRIERVGSQSPSTYRVVVARAVGLQGLEGLDSPGRETHARTRTHASSSEGAEPTPATPATPWTGWEGEGPASCECSGRASDA